MFFCSGSSIQEHILSYRDSDGLQGLPVMPADLEGLNSHTKHSGSGRDDPSGRRLFLEFILTSLWDKKHVLLMKLHIKPLIKSLTQHVS